MNEKQLERDEAHIARLRDSEVEKLRAKVPAPGSVGPEFCPRCDDEIPERRRNAGYQICVECAAENERRRFLCR